MEEGDLVLCTVEQVSNTITHVRLPNGSDGTIISSEIAPGRIKHMRHYVVPNKKIVCKVLEVSGDNIHLSLRRVTSKEKKAVMQQFKQEQALRTGFNQLLPNASEVIDSILSDFSSLTEFMSAARLDTKVIDKYISKSHRDAIEKIIIKKKKGQEIRQKIKLKCFENDGVSKIKEILSFDDPQVSISYVSAGNFDIKLLVEDFKQGKKRLAELNEMIQKRAKSSRCEIFISEEK